jgi:hypothetical protein
MCDALMCGALKGANSNCKYQQQDSNAVETPNSRLGMGATPCFCTPLYQPDILLGQGYYVSLFWAGYLREGDYGFDD